MKDSTKKFLIDIAIYGSGLLLLIGAAAFDLRVEKRQPIDHVLVEKNRAELSRCADAKLCADGFIRMRGSRATLRIASNQEPLFQRDDVRVARLLELLGKNDEEAERFFNRIDSVIFKNDGRWRETFTAYWMDRSLPSY